MKAQSIKDIALMNTEQDSVSLCYVENIIVAYSFGELV